MTEITLFLFRNDLRLQDNAGLAAALAGDQPVLPLFVFDDKRDWSPGSASRWWLHHSLAALTADIEKLGGSLCLRRGDTLAQIEDILSNLQVNKIVFSRSYEPGQCAIEEAVYEQWHEQIEVKRYGGHLLFEPEQILTGQGQPYKVFTPFWKACLAQPEPCLPEPLPLKKADFYKGSVASDKLDDWALLPTSPDWANGLRETWQPGEAGAAKTLDNFLQTALANYDSDRDRPDRVGTSMLSPHLHFGEIAAARLWQTIKQHTAGDNKLRAQGMSFLRELGWRDFSNHLLFNWPHLPEQAFRSEFSRFPWKKDKRALARWQKGLTGYPIVDAGMRQLWHTGWMHNRVRMIVGSFLVKHLLIHWREGEDWFWDTLVDADLANNAAGWQWVAGSGADAAPYFRVFNPILQGKKFDPEGDYVRCWVPELATLDKKYIHEPWEADNDILAQASITLGQDYPSPIIEHSEGRKRALAAFQTFRQKEK